MPARKKTTSATRKKTASKKTDQETVGTHIPPLQDPELRNKVEQCEAACHSLMSSRNKLIVVTIISWLIVLYLLIANPRWSQPTHIETVNPSSFTNPATSSSADCQPCETEQKEDAVTYINKIRKLLDETTTKPDPAIQDERPTISSVLTQGENPELLDHNDSAKRDIIELVYRWALSWELQNIKEYFSYYSRNFDPGQKAEDIGSWKSMKRYYIRKPDWIKITVDDIKVLGINKRSATVTFTQTYDTSTYGDITLKKLQLSRENNDWKIIRESGDVQSVNLKGKG